jgi:hypothetical protein
MNNLVVKNKNRGQDPTAQKQRRQSNDASQDYPKILDLEVVIGHSETPNSDVSLYHARFGGGVRRPRKKLA